jgi:diguanylate cyclase (GGDEF)-like protein
VATVIVVEPPSAERDRLLELLVQHGHKVTLASNGAEALTLWRRERYELAIVDANAPSIAGLELCSRIKSEAVQAFAPVILVVAGASADARAQVLVVADDAVSRPFDPGEVCARANALLRTRRLVEELRTLRAESEARSFADAATGLRNRVFLNERLGEEWKRAARYNEPLSLLVISVEGLRAAADTRGEPFGDRVLHAVANAALRSLRQIDVVTRFGPSELAALLPNTHFAGSLTCAERLHRESGKATVEDFAPLVTMGIAFYPGKDVQEPADLLKLATRALERAREEGPGSICLFQHQGYLFQPKKA